MNRLFTTLVLIVTGSVALGSGCAPKSVSSQEDSAPTVGRDSVIVPDVGYVAPDLVQTGDISVAGAAAFEMMTVADLALLRAQNPRQLQSAEQALGSGAYLGDPVRVVKIRGQADAGVIGYDVGSDVGTGFETDFVVRFREGGGNATFEIVGEPMGPGRRMPSMFRIELSLNGGQAGNDVVLLLGDEGSIPSELGRAELHAFEPDAFAHRIMIRYVPGTITVSFDGEVVLEEAARLGGGRASAAILAHPAETAYVLSWTLEALP